MMKDLTYENICKQKGCLDGEKRFFTSMDLQFDTTFDVKIRNFSSSLFAIVFCEKGTMRLSVDFKEFTLEPDKALIIRPNMTISIVNCWGFKAHGIFFNPIKKHEINISSRDMARFYLSVIHNPIVSLSEAECTQLKLITSLLPTSSPEESSFTDLSVRHWVMALMFSLFNSVLKNGHERFLASSRSRAEYIFEQFILLCNDKFKEQRMVKWYASELCLTPKHLSTSIQQFSGKTANQWIDEMTLQEVCRQLKFTNRSIQEIAYDLNFPNPSYFGKYFKHHIGCSPGVYRQNK